MSFRPLCNKLVLSRGCRPGRQSDAGWCGRVHNQRERYRRGVTDPSVDAVVLGAGVIGLTTAVCLAEAGLNVAIRTAEPPLHTTSAVAGAIWGPHLVEDSDRVTRWCADTLAVFISLAGQPGTGIHLIAGREVSPAPYPFPAAAAPLGELREISPCGPADLPTGFTAGWRYTAPVCSMPVYLEYLLARFFRAGGQLRTAPVASLAAAARDTTAPVIVNCTGIGAHALVPDPALTPVRGQVVIAENPGLTEFFIGFDHDAAEVTELAYIFPHHGRVVLGGAEIAGDWSLEPEPAVAERILRDCAAIEPRLAGVPIIEHLVGLRPVRPQVRLEAGPIPAPQGGPDQRLLVHNYGHGGAGITLSWGCAREVAALIQHSAAVR
jgi:D-amino-acid oxidase